MDNAGMVTPAVFVDKRTSLTVERKDIRQESKASPPPKREEPELEPDNDGEGGTFLTEVNEQNTGEGAVTAKEADGAEPERAPSEVTPRQSTTPRSTPRSKSKNSTLGEQEPGGGRPSDDVAAPPNLDSDSDGEPSIALPVERAPLELPASRQSSRPSSSLPSRRSTPKSKEVASLEGVDIPTQQDAPALEQTDGETTPSKPKKSIPPRSGNYVPNYDEVPPPISDATGAGGSGREEDKSEIQGDTEESKKEEGEEAERNVEVEQEEEQTGGKDKDQASEEAAEGLPRVPSNKVLSATEYIAMQTPRSSGANTERGDEISEEPVPVDENDTIRDAIKWKGLVASQMRMKLGAELLELLLSTERTKRETGIRTAFGHVKKADAGADSGSFISFLCVVVVGLSDESMSVYLLSLQLLQAVTEKFAEAAGKKVLWQLYSEVADILVQRSGDGNQKIMRSSIGMLGHLATQHAHHFGQRFIPLRVLHPPRSESRESWRVIIGRLLTVRMLMKQFKLSAAWGLDFDVVIKFTLSALKDPQSEVSKVASDVFCDIYSLMGSRAEEELYDPDIPTKVAKGIQERIAYISVNEEWKKLEVSADEAAEGDSADGDNQDGIQPAEVKALAHILRRRCATQYVF